jgi:hypothetical protein
LIRATSRSCTGFFERVEIELVEEIDPAFAAAEAERAPAKRTRRKALDLRLRRT